MTDGISKGQGTSLDHGWGQRSVLVIESWTTLGPHPTLGHIRLGSLGHIRLGSLGHIRLGSLRPPPTRITRPHPTRITEATSDLISGPHPTRITGPHPTRITEATSDSDHWGHFRLGSLGHIGLGSLRPHPTRITVATSYSDHWTYIGLGSRIGPTLLRAIAESDK